MTTPTHLWAPRTAASSKQEIEHGDRLAPLFDENGLIPAIVTDIRSREILMFAWMNAEALERTLTSGYAHFWSRSRNRLWQKGEESGNRLAVRKVLTDCDQDVLQITVEIEGDGVACHTGARSCFYREVDAGTPERPLRLRPAQPDD
jgi:phosphoribosyl-AMP cyclohydrolase